MLVGGCAGTEAAPRPSIAAPATTAAPGMTALASTEQTSPRGTDPPTTPTPRLPSVSVEHLGELTEANPAVGGNPGRDIGISVALADGRYLWVFGDTIHDDQTLSNSAGFGSAGSNEIHDWADGNGQLAQFIPYTPEEEAFNRAHKSDGSRWVLWPDAVAAVDGGKRVLIFFERSITNLQPGAGSTTGATGKPTIGMAEWSLAAASKGAIQARRVNDETFKGANLNAAYLDSSGSTLWLLSCSQKGRCQTAKVGVDDAWDGTKWTWWTGRGYSTDVRAGTPLAFPDPESTFLGRTYADGSPYVAAPFVGGNIAYYASKGLYLLAFTALPGYADYGYLRASHSPIGPWGPPLRFDLPACDEPNCYAVTVHPELSRGAGTVGISYHRDPVNHTALVDISTIQAG